MKMKLMTAALLAALAPITMAANNQPYVGLQGTFVDADNLRNNKEGGGATLLFGLPLDRNFAVELNLFGLRMDNDTNSFDKQLGGGLDLALYPLTRNALFAPFLIVGSGAQYEDRNSPFERGYTFLNAGGGFLANLSSDGSVALRVDAKRYRVHDTELIPGRDQLWDTRINAGFQVAFGPDPVIVQPPPPPPVYMPPPRPVDTDGDGVVDGIDQCPGTLPGLRVDAVGCALPLPRPKPVDTDQDGVLDPNDACPGTPIGLKVDSRGCAVREAKIVLRDINFEFNSSRLTYEAQQSLNRVVEGLRGQPTMELLIEGHTDAKGTDAYNLKLSKARSESARAYLIQSGIEGSRLRSNGFGESQPVASNETESGRAENRRVEFKVTQQ